MRDYILVIDRKIPPAFTDENRHETQQALKHGIGQQSAPTAAQITSVRPNQPTVFERDEDGEIISIIAVADEWIIAGDFSAEAWWGNEAEMTTAIEAEMADYFGVPASALKDKMTCNAKSQDGIHQYLRDNAAEWGEGE